MPLRINNRKCVQLWRIWPSLLVTQTFLDIYIPILSPTHFEEQILLVDWIGSMWDKFTLEQGLILHHLRRRLSVSIITAQARCLLTRLHHMAPGSKQAAKKRAFSKYREELAKKDRLYHHEAYIRGRRLHDLGILHHWGSTPKHYLPSKKLIIPKPLKIFQWTSDLYLLLSNHIVLV